MVGFFEAMLPISYQKHDHHRKKWLSFGLILISAFILKHSQGHDRTFSFIKQQPKIHEIKFHILRIQSCLVYPYSQKAKTCL